MEEEGDGIVSGLDGADADATAVVHAAQGANSGSFAEFLSIVRQVRFEPPPYDATTCPSVPVQR